MIQKSTHKTCHSCLQAKAQQKLTPWCSKHLPPFPPTSFLCITNNHYGIRSVSPSHRSVGTEETPSHRSVRFRGPRPLAGLYLDRHFVWGTKSVVHIQPHLTKKTLPVLHGQIFFLVGMVGGEYLHTPKI